ncbi:hypothetical protein VK055_5163 [Klebsiella pneumoniae subsp. pneumoniae]|nr:hypothetical protein VK055_5163 [Klebsiella pneumoniae subsp. pneumoniae]
MKFSHFDDDMVFWYLFEVSLINRLFVSSVSLSICLSLNMYILFS